MCIRLAETRVTLLFWIVLYRVPLRIFILKDDANAPPPESVRRVPIMCLVVVWLPTVPTPRTPNGRYVAYPEPIVQVMVRWSNVQRIRLLRRGPPPPQIATAPLEPDCPTLEKSVSHSIVKLRRVLLFL